MKYAERRKREEYLMYLLENKRLSNLEKIAEDFDCSKRTILRMLNNLRNEGYDISFCRTRKKYILD